MSPAKRVKSRVVYNLLFVPKGDLEQQYKISKKNVCHPPKGYKE